MTKSVAEFIAHNLDGVTVEQAQAWWEAQKLSTGANYDGDPAETGLLYDVNKAPDEPWIVYWLDQDCGDASYSDDELRAEILKAASR